MDEKKTFNTSLPKINSCKFLFSKINSSVRLESEAFNVYLFILKQISPDI